MAKNGELSSSSLTKVGVTPLYTPTARAFNRMAAAAAKAKITIAPVQGGAGGYRSLALQRAMIANPAKYGVSPGVQQKPAGQSTHGMGTAVDIGSVPPASALGRFGDAGRKRRAWLLEHADEYGFSRPFGDSDPNHFQHDGKTAGEAPVDPKSRTVGADGVQRREGPSQKAKSLGVVKAKTKLVMDGYVLGQNVKGNNVWLTQGDHYFHSSGFTSASLTGLSNLTPKPEPVVTRHAVTFEALGETLVQYVDDGKLPAVPLNPTDPTGKLTFVRWVPTVAPITTGTSFVAEWVENGAVEPEPEPEPPVIEPEPTLPDPKPTEPPVVEPEPVPTPENGAQGGKIAAWATVIAGTLAGIIAALLQIFR